MFEREHGSEPHPFQIEGSDIVFVNSKSKEEITREAREQEDHEFKRILVKTNQRLTWLIGLLAIGIFCGSGISIWQASISQTTAQAARDSADAAKTAAITAATTLADITKNDAVSSASSRSASRQEQRAYMGVNGFYVPKSPVAIIDSNRVFNVDFHYLNTGKTPATGIAITAKVAFGDDAERTIKSFKVPTYSPANGSVDIPGHVLSGTASTDPVDDATAKSLVAGQHSIYIYGAIQYQDIFGDSHETGFCGVRQAHSTSFADCPDFGNWIDVRSKTENKIR